MTTKKDDFFENQTIVSFIKADIVAKYFYAWAKIIINKMNPQKVIFADLFAGPGKYEDGGESTPILVTKKVIFHEDLRDKVKLIFNDREKNDIEKLKIEIEKLEGINSLKHKVRFENKTIDLKIIEELKKWPYPTLFFLDPWGYNGIYLKKILEIIKFHGSECIFFFNYKRVNMALENSAFAKNMTDLFGEEFLFELNQVLSSNDSPKIREEIIVGKVWDFFQDENYHIVGFLFKDTSGKKTSHILIHVSKHVLGFNLMKKIMKPYKHVSDSTKAIYMYNPTVEGQERMFDNHIPDLQKQIIKEFKGKKITLGELFNKHNIKRAYTLEDYKEAIKDLEVQNVVDCDPPYEDRKRNTINNEVFVYFK